MPLSAQAMRLADDAVMGFGSPAQLAFSFPGKLGGFMQLCSRSGGRLDGPLNRLRWDALRVLATLSHNLFYVLASLVLDSLFIHC
jgi:hypothetical protein